MLRVSVGAYWDHKIRHKSRSHRSTRALGVSNSYCIGKQYHWRLDMLYRGPCPVVGNETHYHAKLEMEYHVQMCTCPWSPFVTYVFSGSQNPPTLSREETRINLSEQSGHSLYATHAVRSAIFVWQSSILVCFRSLDVVPQGQIVCRCDQDVAVIWIYFQDKQTSNVIILKTVFRNEILI